MNGTQYLPEMDLILTYEVLTGCNLCDGLPSM